MRRDHQSRGAGLELRQIVERPHGCAFRAEVDEQHVPSRDGALDAGEQHQATLARVGQVGSRVEVPVMERDGDDLIAQIGRAVEELDGRVRNAIFGIEVRMGMELGLQHEISIGFEGLLGHGRARLFRIGEPDKRAWRALQVLQKGYGHWPWPPSPTGNELARTKDWVVI